MLVAVVTTTMIILSHQPYLQADSSTFSVVSARLLDSQNGYPIPADSIFYPDETVYLEFKLGGFTINEKHRMKVGYRVDFLSPSGVQFSVPHTGEISEEIFPQDQDWLPVVRVSPKLPQFAEAGLYKIVLTATDRLAGNNNINLEFPVSVRGENVKTSTTLLIRDLIFSHTQGGEAMVDPVYEAGDTVWARFYITGYRIASDNSFDVESSLEVTANENSRYRTLFSFESSGERGSPFYPRRWLPAEFHLDLDDDLLPGLYIVLISVQDNIGNKTLESRRHFRVK